MCSVIRFAIVDLTCIKCEHQTQEDTLNDKDAFGKHRVRLPNTAVHSVVSYLEVNLKYKEREVEWGGGGAYMRLHNTQN
jgi:hypothetical protein